MSLADTITTTLQNAPINDFFNQVSDEEEKARLKKDLDEAVKSNFGPFGSIAVTILNKTPFASDLCLRGFSGCEKIQQWFSDIAFDLLADNGLVDPSQKLLKATMTANAKASTAMLHQLNENMGLDDNLIRQIQKKAEELIKDSFGVLGLSSERNSLVKGLTELHKDIVSKYRGALTDKGMREPALSDAANKAADAIVGLSTSTEDLGNPNFASRINYLLSTDKLHGLARALVDAQPRNGQPARGTIHSIELDTNAMTEAKKLTDSYFHPAARVDNTLLSSNATNAVSKATPAPGSVNGGASVGANGTLPDDTALLSALRRLMASTAQEVPIPGR